MHDLLNVDPKSVLHQITLVRCGYGSSIELFEYSGPDQKNMTPKNSDIGGHHIALYVDDIKAAKDYLDSKRVKTFFTLPVNEGPAAGQTITYFLAPWGLQMEIISYPQGMAYEKSSPINVCKHPMRPPLWLAPSRYLWTSTGWRCRLGCRRL
jgi:catechol 2,3-dioxygenase-like lactoylglutathione lyase family enzyme